MIEISSIVLVIIHRRAQPEHRQIKLIGDNRSSRRGELTGAGIFKSRVRSFVRFHTLLKQLGRVQHCRNSGPPAARAGGEYNSIQLPFK